MGDMAWVPYMIVQTPSCFHVGGAGYETILYCVIRSKTIDYNSSDYIQLLKQMVMLGWLTVTFITLEDWRST